MSTYLLKRQEQTTSTKHKCQLSNINNANWTTKRDCDGQPQLIYIPYEIPVIELSFT